MFKKIKDEIEKDHGVSLILIGILLLTAIAFVGMIGRMRGDF